MPVTARRVVQVESSDEEDEYYDDYEEEEDYEEDQEMPARKSAPVEESSSEEEESEYESEEEEEEEVSDVEEYSDDDDGPQLHTGIEPVIQEEEPEQWAGDEPNDVEQSRPGAQAVRSSSKARSSKKKTSRTILPPPQQSNREINPDFKDVQETGKWGNVSRREFYIVLAVAIAVIIAIVVVVVILVTGNDSSSEEALETRPPAPTAVPTQAPTRAPVTDVATSLRNQIASLPSITGTLSDLPEDEAFYEDLYLDPNQPANVRAMSWIFYGDPSQPGPNNPHLGERYALATLFYATVGDNWIDSVQWLMSSSICDWNGLFCDVQDRLVELDLSSNNLQKQLPNEIALLQHLKAFSVRRNQLTGPVPALAFHDIPGLSILYLDNNMFTGELPEIMAEGVLSVLFTQQNNFTKGFFPLGFCDEKTGLTLDKAGLDCDITRCLCCNPTEHCL